MINWSNSWKFRCKYEFFESRGPNKWKKNVIFEVNFQSRHTRPYKVFKDLSFFKKVINLNKNWFKNVNFLDHDLAFQPNINRDGNSSEIIYFKLNEVSRWNVQNLVIFHILFEKSKVTFSSYSTFIFSRYYNECAGIYVSVDKDHGIHKTVEKIKLRENGKSNFGFGFLGCIN